MAGREKNPFEDEELVDTPVSRKMGLVNWFLIGFGVVVLMGISVATSIYIMRSMIAVPAAEAMYKSRGAGLKEDEKKHRDATVAIYYKFDPPFVVNIQGQYGNRFLQLNLEAMTYDKAISKEIDQDLPLIRNNILLLLSNVTYEQISTLEGKQKLRSDILGEIRKVMQDKTGKPGVEEVYLTGMVVQ